MFYSHQLLARKAPLGQIWMAATLHAKINRKKLNKLNIIRICEEILNPSVPMALRLSGILMGGVVIVYERKVKLLYDDVTRLLVEINEAWKVKVAPDPTVLPKGKSQARKEAVTLPENQETDMGENEQSLNYSNAATTTIVMGFASDALCMLQNPYDCGCIAISIYYSNIMSLSGLTMWMNRMLTMILGREMHPITCIKVDTDAYNRFERFDIEGDEETQVNFTSADHMDIPTTPIPSPNEQDEAQRDMGVDMLYAEENQDHHPQFQVNQQPSECKRARQDQQKQRLIKRKTKRQATITVDYEQTIIPGHEYQSWLHNVSDIVSRRGRKRKARMGIMSTSKISNLMELPPTVLIDDNGNREIYYPAPLLELWNKSTRPPHESPSEERTSAPLPPEPSISSLPDTTFDDAHSGAGSQSLGTSIEKLRTNVVNDGLSMDILLEELKANLGNNGVRMTEANMATPRNSGDGVGSIPGSGSGHGIPPHYFEVNLGRSNKKGPHSSSRHSGGCLRMAQRLIKNCWLKLDLHKPNI
ncbi:hypothetical protein OIU77_015214 [Salix suchowensis]|uniref:Rad21/Rec8-like protein N-terminal domain-containing protein n=1 Tax=Salix suchowensis TaxID=1278906 RepID=A0ABQ8ZTI8_9ROSI|nr:hypothetical protein OIU77_015214 [Salix suchowensis]